MRSVISEPSAAFNAKYRKAVHSLERYKVDEQIRSVGPQEDFHLQPLLRVRSLKAIDHRTLSAPSSPVLQPRYRSHERSNMQYQQQSSNHQNQHDHFQNSISKSASMPNGGFPVQPILLRERVIDRHVAERSASRSESQRQNQQESSGKNQSTSAAANSQTLNRSIPVYYENGSNSSYRQSSHVGPHPTRVAH